jgi:hypothetical protein
MTSLIVSAHAVQRYRERVKDVPDVEAERALSGRAFQSAADLGRCAVILPTGHRAIVHHRTVITVLPLGGHAFFGHHREPSN